MFYFKVPLFYLLFSKISCGRTHTINTDIFLSRDTDTVDHSNSENFTTAFHLITFENFKL